MSGSEKTGAPDTLIATLGLERLEVNLFRGTTPGAEQRHRIFGGQVIAQSLLAAYETVEARVCHSLHCYFIRPGDPSIPIIFEVDRSRDGGSFTTRRVIAVQHGQQIFNLAASFQVDEQGYEHQSDMPDAPSPEEVEGDAERRKRLAAMTPPEDEDWIDRHQPIEMKTVGGRFDVAAYEPLRPIQQVWFRARDPIGEDQHLHQVIMAYASDMSLLGTSIRPHGVSWRTPGFQAASLDHAMWFHRPTNFNDWHLSHQESPSAAGGR
ncbi:MAG TPA: acyl-CoA thioesterase II, partial [Phenylobacterium sp.]|nr:acyl-CoA thioesterase II [Phenylobacterium sp.]